MLIYNIFNLIIENLYTVMIYSIIITYLLIFISSFIIKFTFSKYNRKKYAGYYTGSLIAQKMLRENNIYNVSLYVDFNSNSFNDHYSPKKKHIILSNPVANGNTLVSMAVAAHEVGHALQDKKNNILYIFRQLFVYVVNISSLYSTPLLIYSLITYNNKLFKISILSFFSSLLFAIITFPVEVDASIKAYNFLVNNQIIVSKKEKKAVKSILRAAAFTYFVAIFKMFTQSILRLSRFI